MESADTISDKQRRPERLSRAGEGLCQGDRAADGGGTGTDKIPGRIRGRCRGQLSYQSSLRAIPVSSASDLL